MRKVFLFSILLLLGLIGSQFLPVLLQENYVLFGDAFRVLTMIFLSFIMIRVGYEFDIDKSNLKQYGWDYAVAFTAASFPWIFVSVYFVFVLLPPDVWTTLDAWKESALAGRFAAPTSAGVLFSMLAAAGLGATWLYNKARILAIFDDLDTVLLMIPLKMLMVGFVWQLGLIVVVMAVMLSIAFIFLHKVRIPITWLWTLLYSLLITIVSEIVYKGSQLIDESVPIHIEVLLPAFVLGAIIAYPRNGGEHPLESADEKKKSTIVAAIFMVLVGLSMPMIINDKPIHNTHVNQNYEQTFHAGGNPDAEARALEVGKESSTGRISANQPPMEYSEIALHVLLITIISNIGKMFPMLCYRKEAHWRERLALAIGMWPRGEVGAGILVISISYGIGGPIVTIAMLSLTLNLLLTGVVIYMIRKITKPLKAYN